MATSRRIALLKCYYGVLVRASRLKTKLTTEMMPEKRREELVHTEPKPCAIQLVNSSMNASMTKMNAFTRLSHLRLSIGRSISTTQPASGTPGSASTAFCA
jgi:hypothetical protein